MNVFVHIPSSAGTTLWSVLRAGTGVRIKRVRAGGFEENAEALRALVPQVDGELEVVGGHLPIGALDGVDDQARYFTFLREPHRRMESDFFRKVRNGLVAEPEDAETRVLAYAQRRRRSTIRLLTNLASETIDENYDRDGFGREVVERVRNRFQFVGFVEVFDDSLIQLADVLGWPRAPSYERRNKGGNKVVLSSETRNRLAEILHLECAVYDALWQDFQAQRAERTMRVRAARYSLAVRNGLRSAKPSARERYVKR